MNIYSAAFTSELVDENNNYQFYEQLGDKLGGSFLVWYMYRRFPQLKCAEGVKVVARLLINYGAKQSFYKIAEELDFWSFITAPNEIRQRQKKPLLEDVFEAFLGATGSILDDRVVYGLGYTIVYRFLEAVFDDMSISLQYEDLYDAKTRLKELLDMYGSELGCIFYKDTREEVERGIVTHSVVYLIKPNEKAREIGKGSAALKSDAQQAAARNALALLNGEGWVKPIPKVYARFAAGKKKKENTYKKSDFSPETINELVATKKKTKYQSQYASTRLAEMCRKRNVSGVKACLECGADPNIPDTDGMLPLDLVFIGVRDERVERIVKYLRRAKATKVSDSVFDAYVDDEYSDLAGLAELRG